jgi:ribosomal protein L11 methyltransferase
VRTAGRAGGGPDDAANVVLKGPWLELAIEADLEAVEAVSEILARVATGGTSVEPGFELLDDGLAARLDASRPAVVRGYVPARKPVDAEAAVLEVGAALGHLRAFGLRPIGELRTRVIEEADWAAAWKVHFPVLRVGRRIVVRPTWRRHRPRPGEVVVALDPGMAFGTGLHPTTRLCLAALEAFAATAPLGRVLDLGSGSGILSIAAVGLGATSVSALDVDEIAVEASRANARRNRMARRIEVRRGSLPSGQPPFDTVVANLIGSLLVSLADGLVGELRPSGRLLASGIFRDREAEVRGAFDRAGLRVEQRWLDEDWVALGAIRSDPRMRPR